MSEKSQPEEDAGDGEQGMVGGLQFLIAGGDGPVLLEAVGDSLDDFAFTIGSPIEADVLARFGGAARDDGADAISVQIRAGRMAGVALVTNDAVGAQARAAPSGTAHLALLQALPGGQKAGHRLAAPLGPEVDFRGEAAAGAA